MTFKFLTGQEDSDGGEFLYHSLHQREEPFWVGTDVH
jgi:hypothetical protein